MTALAIILETFRNILPKPDLSVLSINYFSDICGKRRPDQCTVNRYFPGQGIPPHVDNHECCDDTIMSLSLLSDVVMNFTDLESKKMIPVNLPRRSLMVMTGRTRYAFR